MLLVVNNQSLNIFSARYPNGRVALVLYTLSGEPYAKVTTNIPEMDIPHGYCFIKNWSENVGILEQLVEQGILNDTLVYIESNYVRVPVCEIKKMPETLERFLQNEKDEEQILISLNNELNESNNPNHSSDIPNKGNGVEP